MGLASKLAKLPREVIARARAFRLCHHRVPALTAWDPLVLGLGMGRYMSQGQNYKEMLHGLCRILRLTMGLLRRMAGVLTMAHMVAVWGLLIQGLVGPDHSITC